MNTLSRQKGFTLVELLVAFGLGLSLVAGAITVFIQNNRSVIQDEQVALMMENGRYVMRLLSRELAMAGFWGTYLDIDTTTFDASAPPAAIGTDCGDGTPWAFDLQGLDFLNNPDTDKVLATLSCLPSASIQPNTDILVTKRVADRATADGALVTGQLYLRTNGQAATMFRGVNGTAPPVMAGADNWAYFPRAYYLRNFSIIGDGIPTLCRAFLNNATPAAMVNECLVDGIENIQLDFGVDDDQDFVANYYTNAPDAAEIANSVSVRLYVLVRSLEQVPDYTNDKTYTLGNTVVAAANDGFYRRVFNTSVVLRNPQNLIGL